MNKDFYEKYSEQMPEKAIFLFDVKEREDFVLNHVTGSVLDVGCSKGYYSKIVSDETGLRVKGIDISEKAILIAKQSFPNLEFETKNLEIESLNEQFETVLLFDVLEHVFDTNSFLFNLNKATKFGGTLIFSLPNVLGIKDRIRFLFGNGEVFMHDYVEPHIRFFTTKTLEKKLSQFGFTVIKYYNNKNVPLPMSLRGSILGVAIKENSL